MLFHALHAVNYIKPVVPTAIMVGVSPTILLTHTAWRTVSLILPSKWYYPVEDAIWGWYQKVIVFFFEQCTGIELRINGEIPTKKENCVFICNHQSSMDWVVADFIAIRQSMVGDMRYVFKSILKYFPMYGYIWGVHGGIFVTRDGKYNTKHMKSKLKSLMKLKVPLYLVIFPEGTRFATNRHELIAKSQGFAFQKRVIPLSNVLTPRVKAFYCALDTMKGYATAVYDVTIIYESKTSEKGTGVRPVRAPTMWNILSGQCKAINLIFDRVPINKVPVAITSDTPTFQWLHARFQLKDFQLASFYGFENLLPLSEDGTIKKFDDNFPMKKLDSLPLKTVALPALSLIGITAGLLLTEQGRKIYGFTVFGGTGFCWVYAKLFL